MRLAANIAIFGQRELSSYSAFLLAQAEYNQSLCIPHRQRLQQNRVHHAEDGRVRADAQHQRENRDGGHPEVLTECARSVADVVPEGLHSAYLCTQDAARPCG